MKYRQQMLSLVLVAITAFAHMPALADDPRLILQITIDQLRGDMLARCVEDRLGEDGFRYLLE